MWLLKSITDSKNQNCCILAKAINLPSTFDFSSYADKVRLQEYQLSQHHTWPFAQQPKENCKQTL